MPKIKLLDNPEVVTLIAKQSDKAVKAANKEVLALIKEQVRVAKTITHKDTKNAMVETLKTLAATIKGESVVEEV